MKANVTSNNMYNWLLFILRLLEDDKKNDFYKQIARLVKKYNKERFDLEINPLTREY